MLLAMAVLCDSCDEVENWAAPRWPNKFLEACGLDACIYLLLFPPFHLLADARARTWFVSRLLSVLQAMFRLKPARSVFRSLSSLQAPEC